MRFQTRDGHLLQTIHDYGGVLSREQIQAMFWPAASTSRAVAARLAKLCEYRYIDWPDQEQRNSQPGPKSICWLGWRGVLWVAAQAGIKVKEPANEGENQMRKLDRELRAQGLRWLREPRWSQLEHDLAVVDFRIAVETEMSRLPGLYVEHWVNETEFRADTDVVEYTYQTRSGAVKRGKRGVIPDSYFVLVNRDRLSARNPEHKARFLLELDNTTHALGRFAREKLIAGATYLRSSAYETRFGSQAGHWLIVTTGEVRLRNLLALTVDVMGHDAGLFLFTTINDVRPGAALSAPIWRTLRQEEPQALIW